MATMAGIRSKSTPVCGPGQVAFDIGERYGCSKCSGDGQGTNFRTGQQEGMLRGRADSACYFRMLVAQSLLLKKILSFLAACNRLFIMIIFEMITVKK
jgi:hypothetical protein